MADEIRKRLRKDCSPHGVEPFFHRVWEFPAIKSSIIFMLVRQRCVVMIMVSSSLHVDVLELLGRQDIEFDRIYYIPVPANAADVLTSGLIKVFKPVHNSLPEGEVTHDENAALAVLCTRESLFGSPEFGEMVRDIAARAGSGESYLAVIERLTGKLNAVSGRHHEPDEQQDGGIVSDLLKD